MMAPIALIQMKYKHVKKSNSSSADLKNNLKIHYTNKRSLRLKINFLRGPASAETLDIIETTKTWMDLK